MSAVEKERVGFCKAVDISLEVSRKALHIPARQINESGLPATGTASAALELRHNGRKTAHDPQITQYTWFVDRGTDLAFNYLLPSCFSTKSPITGNL
jgi:hypothetical protein